MLISCRAAKNAPAMREAITTRAKMAPASAKPRSDAWRSMFGSVSSVVSQGDADGQRVLVQARRAPRDLDGVRAGPPPGHRYLRPLGGGGGGRPTESGPARERLTMVSVPSHHTPPVV